MAYRNVSVWLEDLLMAIKRINEYTATLISYSDYKKSQLIIDATERNLEIVAEALKNALTLEPGLPVSHSKKIIGLEIL